MSVEECEKLCQDAGLNVRTVTQTARYLIVQVGKSNRSSRVVIRRLQALASDRDLPEPKIFFSENPKGDDEYWLRVR